VERDERGEAPRLLPVIQKESDHPCFECAKCCTYIAIEIDDPSTNKEYDQILWYLYHRDVEVFVDWDGDWHVLFRTRCENLTDAGLCAVYERRPAICKDFDWRECEQRFTPEDGPPDKYLWTTAEQFAAWLAERRPRAWARYQEHLRRAHAHGEDAETLRVTAAPRTLARRRR
jgi:Fe-S-cluster containining protein